MQETGGPVWQSRLSNWFPVAAIQQRLSAAGSLAHVQRIGTPTRNFLAQDRHLVATRSISDHRQSPGRL
jgi:hypothetical protein